ncbi:MAG TPA: DNA recombination/repair protein RecA [Clostridiales bacterium]|nr:DNA recombination/repair protein RecA [Clostridiales bacterium]
MINENYRNSNVETQEYKEFKKAMAALNKKMTNGAKDEVAIAPLGEMDALDVETISTGSVVLDNLLGGGFPVGRVVEIFGKEASGKTSIALNAVADVQRKGGNALFIDAEQALDPSYAAVLGVDIDKLGISQIMIAEHVLYTVRNMISSGTVNLIVIDTVASMIPQAEFDAPEKQTMALLARILSKELRLIAKLANEQKCTVIFLNQIREKVGIMFGNPETTPGGNALKFYASQRLQISRAGQYKEGSIILGTEVRFRVVKNKIAPPFQSGTTILTFAKGINRPAEIIEVGSDIGALNLKGRTYSLPIENPEDFKDHVIEEDGTIKLGTSKKSAIEALEENVDLFNVAAKRVAEAMDAKRAGGIPFDPLNSEKEDQKVDVEETESDDVFSV